MHQYRGFGLNIASDIEFPELLAATFTHPDITIIHCAVNSDIPGDRYEQDDYATVISPTEYYLDIKGNCRYQVLDNDIIHIDPYPGIDGRSIRLFLLGSVMAFILFRKGLIPLHASGIIKNDKVILFTGDSGAGKSTTIAQLALRGYKIFTDDICVIGKDGKGTASYPMLKLWDDTLALINAPAYNNKDFRLKPDIDKYGHFFHEKFHEEAATIGTIFIISKDDSANEVRYNKLSGHKAFDALAQQVYRRYLIADLTLRTIYFKTITALAGGCHVIEIYRPAGNDIHTFIDKLETLFNEQTPTQA